MTPKTGQRWLFQDSEFEFVVELQNLNDRWNSVVVESIDGSYELNSFVIFNLANTTYIDGKYIYKKDNREYSWKYLQGQENK